MKRTFKLYIPLMLLMSCSKDYRIPSEDYKLIPYMGNEKLVFESNTGVRDTVFLQGLNKFFSPINNWEFPTKNSEHYQLLSKRTDPNYDRYLDSLKFVTLINDGETKISIEFTAKGAWLYGNFDYTKKDFINLSVTSVTVGKDLYNDVVVFESPEIKDVTNNSKQKRRENAIQKFYWSKTHGVIKYEQSGNRVWLLKKTL